MRILNIVEHDNCKISIHKLIGVILWSLIPLFTVFGFPFVITWYKDIGVDNGITVALTGILSIASILIIIHPIDIWEDIPPTNTTKKEN